MNVNIKEKKISNNWTLYLKELENKEKAKCNVSRRKELTNIRAEINKIETKEAIENINKTKSWCFQNINIIGKHFARLRKKERFQIKSEMKEETLQLIPHKCKVP